MNPQLARVASNRAAYSYGQSRFKIYSSVSMISSLATLCHESLLRAHLRDDPYITEEEHLDTLRGKFCSQGYGLLFECPDDLLVVQAKATFWWMSEIKIQVMNREGCHCTHGRLGLHRCTPWYTRCRKLGSGYKKHTYAPY